MIVRVTKCLQAGRKRMMSNDDIENKEELIKQLWQKMELNKQIINNFKEFFGTYQSDFLKMYRNKEESDEKLKEILAQQDQIFSKFNELMKEK